MSWGEGEGLSAEPLPGEFAAAAVGLLVVGASTTGRGVERTLEACPCRKWRAANFSSCLGFTTSRLGRVIEGS
jgi:hypothetical protein